MGIIPFYFSYLLLLSHMAYVPPTANMSPAQIERLSVGAGTYTEGTGYISNNSAAPGLLVVVGKPCTSGSGHGVLGLSIDGVKFPKCK
jgi:hypothetical protein